MLVFPEHIQAVSWGKACPKYSSHSFVCVGNWRLSSFNRMRGSWQFISGTQQNVSKRHLKNTVKSTKNYQFFFLTRNRVRLGTCNAGCCRVCMCVLLWDNGWGKLWLYSWFVMYSFKALLVEIDCIFFCLYKFVLGSFHWIFFKGLFHFTHRGRQ